MIVNVDTTFYRSGSIGYAKGTDEKGDTVYFATDWRPIRDMADALKAGEEVQCEVEQWMLISFEQYMAEQAVSLKEIGPYTRVAYDEKRMYRGTEFRIVVYGAYNAMGLVGSEVNGIVVLREDPPDVIADEIACDPSANPNSRSKQIELAKTILVMNDDEFQSFVNSQKRLRFTI